MPDFTPAPVSTTISAPSAFSFLTVSGVAATRGSAASTSAGTAIFMEPPRGRERSNEEIGHQDEQDNEENDAPFGQRDEHRVGGLVLGIIIAVRRRVFDLTVVGHLDSPHKCCSPELAQLGSKGNGAKSPPRSGGRSLGKTGLGERRGLPPADLGKGEFLDR